MFSFILLILLFNTLFLIFFSQISNKIKIFDNPLNNLKLHKKKISAIGGLLFLISVFFYIIFNNYKIDNNYLSTKENFSIILFILIFFLKGMYDDQYVINANTKITISILLILVFLFINPNFIIQNLKFSFINYEINLKNFSFFFTLICILLFINACNMFDGINLQFCFYILILSVIFLSKSTNENLFIAIIISCIFFLYLNYKNLLFIGNNGTLFFGAFYSVLFIYNYNITSTIKTADEIFLYMSIVGFDFLRVTFSRLLKGKNIFLGDLNHIHHILIKKHSLITSTLLIQSIIIIPIIYANLTNKYLYGCLISLILYISLFHYSKKNNRNN
jgi:UDP-GlcNAc:undecaprenyl-phosphate/decaprenyl-phosphate GlcNAc-1-phosphate transferase